MARSGINKVILVGNLGKDPETRFFPSGGAVTNISLATSDSWKDKQTGENQERTEWHRVSFFNRLAEIAGEYLKKGSKVYIEGRLQTRKWQDQSGADRYTTEVVASDMQMLDSRGGAQQSDDFNSPPAMDPSEYGAPSDFNAPTNQAGGQQQQPANTQNKPAQQPAVSNMDDLDDDIPF